METEKIISTLKEKIGTTSLSDRTISDYVGNNLLAEGTEPDDAYFDKHTNILKSLSGNFNADVAKGVEDFKKNYKPTNVNVPPKPATEPTNDFEARLKAIEDAQNEKYEALKKELEDKDKALMQKSYVSNLEEKFKADLESKSLIYDPIYFEHISRENGEFDTNKSVEDAIKDIRPKYDKMFKDRSRAMTSNGFSVGFEPIQPAHNGTMTAAEATRERYRQQGKLPEHKD